MSITINTMEDRIKLKLKEQFNNYKTTAAKKKLANSFDMTLQEFKEYIESVTPIKDIESVEANLTDIVIAFDTTGSMASYIENVKTHVSELVSEMLDKNPNLKIGIVAFGDYCDMVSNEDFGRAYQVINLTNNTEKLIAFVKNAKNTGGGDGDEFYELVLHKIRTETSWRKDSNKSILLIGDSLPHTVGYRFYNKKVDIANMIDWKVEAAELKKADIKVDTLSVTVTHVEWYKLLSIITGGLHLPFKSSQKTSTLLEGYLNVRSGNLAEFEAKYDAVKESGDEELIGVYKTLSTL